MSYAEDMGYDGYDETDFEPALKGDWTTADGKLMCIKDMDNNHLKNAYLKLKRTNKRPQAQEVLLEEMQRRVRFAEQCFTAKDDFAEVGL